MLKKILTIMLAFVMMFSFTACNISPEAFGALIGLFGNLEMGGEQEGGDTPGENDQAAIGNGGSVIIGGGEGDGELNSIIVFNNLNAEMFINMTVGELKEFAGKDVSYTEDWLYGASRGVYYADGRIPATFYFTDDQYRSPEEYDGSETILMVIIAGETIPPCESLTGSETFHDLLDREECQLYENLEFDGNSTTLRFGDKYVTYTWLRGSDPYQGPADLIEVGRAY